MPLNSTVQPLVRDRKYGVAISDLIEQLRLKAPQAAQALSSLANSVNDIYRSIAQPTVLEDLVIVDPQGRKIIELNPLGFITVQDASGHQVVTLGDVLEVPLAITAATAATPSVLTVPGNTYENGDTIQVLGALGTVFSTYRIVEAVGISGAGTFTTTDLSGTPIAGAGAYAGGATAERYYGGLLTETIAIGQSFANYKLRAFADGRLVINGATITLNSANGTITLDPTVPAITVSDSGGNQWAALEIIKESPLAITGATNASPSVLTVVGNAYVNGDTVIVAGALGNTAINGYRIVQNVGTAGADTFTMTDIAGTQINGNGAYTGSGTATRYYAGGRFQSIAIGPDWANYKLRAFADGSLRIQNAAITISGSPFTITMDPTTGFNVTGNGITTLVNNTTRDGFAAGLYVYTTSSNGNPMIITPGRISCNYTVGSGTSRFILGASGAGDTQLVLNSTSAGFGNQQIASITTTGGLQINGNNLANATNCTITTQGVATFAGTVDAVSGFKKNGVSGLSVSRSFGTSLTVNTVANGVIGTPGAGQSNTTLVTGVTLSVASNTWSGGILTT